MHTKQIGADVVMEPEEHDKVPFAVPFAAGLHRDDSIRIYVDGKDCGLQISRNAAGTGVIIEAPAPLKAMDTNPEAGAAKLAAMDMKARDNDLLNLISLAVVVKQKNTDEFMEYFKEQLDNYISKYAGEL